MSDMTSDRLEPMAGVPEIRGQETQRESGQGSKRRPPHRPDDREEEVSPEPEKHEINSLA